MKGCGIEVGCNSEDTILPGCIGFTIGTPHYDGLHLPIPTGSVDYVYSSHCLEHMNDAISAIREWWRVVKHGGHIVMVVPHRDLYEKKMEMPSRFSGEHMRFYTPASLLLDIEIALQVNSYRIRHLCDNDDGFDYEIPDEVHSKGSYEVEVVVEKI